MKNIQLKQNGRFYFGWLVVLLGFILMTFAQVSFVSLTSVFVIPVTEDLGFFRGDFMTYVLILALAATVFAPIIGKLMNKGNIRIYMLIGCLLGFIGYLGFSRAENVTHFYIFAVFLGIAFAAITPMPISILINNWFGGKFRGTANGLAFIGSGLGGLILSPLLNMIILATGWRTAYLFLGLIFLILLPPFIFFFGITTPEDKGFHRMGETEEDLNSRTVEKSGLTLKQAKSTPELWLAVVSTILVVIASSALLANSVSYFVECGINQNKAASLHGLMLGSLILGKPVGGFICDKFGIKAGAVVTTSIFTITFITLYVMPVSPAILVYGVILCYCLGGPTITIMPPLLVNGLFGEKEYAAIVGIMTMASNIGGAFGGTIAAKIYDASGSYSMFWIIATASVFLAVILRIAAFKVNKKRHTW